MSDELRIKEHDKFVHRRRNATCIVNFVAVTKDVGYRIQGTRRIRVSSRANFLKNWTPLYPQGVRTEASE